MPYLKITARTPVDAHRKHDLLETASKLVAAELGKPEQYMMVSLQDSVPMLLAGTTEPSAFLELRGIGLPESKSDRLSRALCQLIESQLGIRQDRVYINFIDVAPRRWGWNGGTF